MNKETQEIIDHIESALALGKNEIIFRDNELNSNPALQSALDSLLNSGVITKQMHRPIGNNSINIKPELIPRRIKLPNSYEDPHTQVIMQENDRRYNEWNEKSDAHIKSELSKIEWWIPFQVDKNKYNAFLDSIDLLGFKDKKFFRFDGLIFKLKKTDGDILPLVFSSYCEDPFLLFSAMIELLQNQKEEGNWLVGEVSSRKIINMLKTRNKLTKVDWKSWIGDTKHNLKTKMDSQSFTSDFIEILRTEYRGSEGFHKIKIKKPS